MHRETWRCDVVVFCGFTLEKEIQLFKIISSQQFHVAFNFDPSGAGIAKVQVNSERSK